MDHKAFCGNFYLGRDLTIFDYRVSLSPNCVRKMLMIMLIV